MPISSRAGLGMWVAGSVHFFFWLSKGHPAVDFGGCLFQSVVASAFSKLATPSPTSYAATAKQLLVAVSSLIGTGRQQPVASSQLPVAAMMERCYRGAAW